MARTEHGFGLKKKTGTMVDAPYVSSAKLRKQVKEWHLPLLYTTFAMASSKGPWPELMAQPCILPITSMFQFFECLELLRKMGRYAQDSHMLPRDRFHRVAVVIDRNTYFAHKASLDYYQSLLDDVYTAWKLHSEEQGALQ